MADSRFLPVVHGAAADRPDEADTVVAAGTIHAALGRLGWNSEIVHVGLDLTPLAALVRRHPVAVFNLVEALDGDGALAPLAPAVLDHAGLRYTGGPADAFHLTLSKTAAKRLLRAAGLPTPPWSETGHDLHGASRAIVKSLTEHASLGIDAASVVDAAEAPAEVARRQARFGGRFFAEAYIDGREFNLSVIERDGQPYVLPPAEIDFVDYPDHRPRIVDYEAKWDAGSFAFDHTPRRFDFAPEDGLLLKQLQDLARRSWTLFGLHGYARVDFRVDAAGTPWILEINVNPCLSPDAGFAAAAARGGLDYDGMVAAIVGAALNRDI